MLKTKRMLAWSVMIVCLCLFAMIAANPLFSLFHSGNNIRMAMETAVMMAVTTGRTLVLPPQQKFYLLHKQKAKFGFGHFFHFDSIQAEHDVGLKIISFEEFLEQYVMKGKLKDPRTGRASFPPGNRTDWNDILNYQSAWLYDARARRWSIWCGDFPPVHPRVL